MAIWQSRVMTQETLTPRFSELVGQGMIWAKPKPSWTKGGYDLRLGEQRLATLKLRSMWGTFATGETSEGSWTFKRVGFFQNRVTVRTLSSDAEIGVFVNDWKMGGTLALPDGRQYRGNTNFWMTKFAFTNETGEPVVSYRRIGGVSLSAAVEIEPAGAALRELPWLVLLGWYVAVMMHQDAAMGGAVGSGAAG